jgi:hypothetical protein
MSKLTIKAKVTDDSRNKLELLNRVWCISGIHSWQPSSRPVLSNKAAN